MTAQTFQIRPCGDEHRAWVGRFIAAQWGAETIVVHASTYLPAALPGFIAWQDEEQVGLITYTLDGGACEIVTLDSQRPGIGIGAALVEAVRRVAQKTGCRRLWLISTNDNLNALRFYQKRGFALAAIHRDAVTRARRAKPQIPLIGQHGIPLRDELELEMLLAGE